MNGATVSVIIPNYNHAIYLAKRIESVLDQTYKHLEVIILDDNSTDSSREIIRNFAAKDERIRTFFNKENSGSTFKQWEKGMALAKGEYIWIAESDDYAEPTFLEKLIKLLEQHKEVGVAYSQSWKVNEKGEIVESYKEWTKDLKPQQRWEKGFITNGKEELRNIFCLKNTIPNASAALIRKSCIKKIQTDMKLVGDKMFWTNILLTSDVAFIPEHLNYFRHHDNNVRTKSKDEENLIENFRWASHLFSEVNVPRENRLKVQRRLFMWWVGILRKPDLNFKNQLQIAKAAQKFHSGAIALIAYYFFKDYLYRIIKN